MQTQILNWQLAGSFSDLLRPSRPDADKLALICQPGIYLWVENQSDKRFANYVGKASESMLQRTLEHYGKFLQLQYSIPARYNNALRYVVTNSDRYTAAVGYDAFLSPCDLSGSARQQKLDALWQYLSCLQIYIASLPEQAELTANRTMSAVLRQVEKQLISDCVPVENISSTAEVYQHYQLEHRGALLQNDITILRQNSLMELMQDHTRPSKARGALSLVS